MLVRLPNLLTCTLTPTLSERVIKDTDPVSRLTEGTRDPPQDVVIPDLYHEEVPRVQVIAELIRLVAAEVTEVRRLYAVTVNPIKSSGVGGVIPSVMWRVFVQLAVKLGRQPGIIVRLAHKRIV